MTQAFYEPLGRDEGGEIFLATPHTVSAWGPDLQHGAPPSAILTRAMGRLDTSPGARMSRIAVDLLGPVPLGELRTRARVVRPGRRIQLLEAELVSDGRVVARAAGWLLRTADTADVEQTVDPPRVLPGQGHESSFFSQWTSGYIDALEIRQDTDGAVWARPRLPLVAGEEMTPAERAMAVADIANGVGAVLDPTEWRFLNTDIVAHLHRLPAGEWIGVTADASVGPDGVGTTSGRLHDEQGAMGHTLQSLLIERI